MIVKIDTDELTKGLVKTGYKHCLKTCPINRSKCLFKEDIEEAKTLKEQVVICAGCWSTYLVQKAEVKDGICN